MSQTVTTTYTYDRADRIQQAGATSYTLNANGNLVARGTDSFAYDQSDRLKSATIGGATSTYVYDGDGKRVGKTVGITTTSYVYDVNRSLPVLLDDGSRKYVWGVGLTYAVDVLGNAQVHHADGLGSVRAPTDGTATIIQTYQTDEFGVSLLTQGTSTNPFQYTGEQQDAESGFTYLRARMYDPAIGRFLSRDTYPGTLPAPRSLNRYTYVQNNPATLTDPSGHVCIPCVVVVVVAIYEIGSSIVDAVTTVQTWQDPEASLKEKVGVTGLFFAGVAGPGGGYATAANSVAKMAKVRQLGHAGEELAGITRNTRRIPSITGASYRIPDEISDTAKVIREVKNVGRLSFTKQLQDIAAFAQGIRYKLELRVRKGTELSSPLQEASDKGLIIVRRDLP